MYPPLDLRQVQCFVAAAASGTMTAAANELHLSQSAVSLGVAGLERRLGVQLLIRRRARPLLLTPAGRRLLPTARELLASAEGLQREAAATSGVAGPLTVGCFTTLAPLVLPELLDGFLASHPEVDLGFLDGPVPELEAAMRAGTCDLAIVDVLDASPDVELEPLMGVRPYALFAAGDPLARRRSVKLEDLARREDLILFSLPPSDAFLMGLFTARGLAPPRVRHRTSSHELVRGLVGRGLGYALLATRPAHDLTHEGREVVAVRIAGDVADARFALARVKGSRLTRQAAAFGRLCRERLGAARSSDPRSGSRQPQ